MIDFSFGQIPEDEMKRIRRALYHSSEPGYYFFRKFLPEPVLRHIVDFWTVHVNPSHSHEIFRGKHQIRYGCPNFVRYHGPNDVNRVFLNFLWNEGPDQVTQTAAYRIQMLRNQIEARPIYHEIFPGRGRSVSYRVVHSVSGGFHPAHQDYVGADYDPVRIQATLWLSRKNIDYSEGGVHFRTNGGRDIIFGDDVPFEPGDLMFWRYGNFHWVDACKTEPGQFGSMRILFPPEAVAAPRWDEKIDLWQENLRLRLEKNRYVPKILTRLTRKPEAGE